MSDRRLSRRELFSIFRPRAPEPEPPAPPPPAEAGPPPEAEVRPVFAVRDWQRCQAFWGTPCDACKQACPTPRAIYLDNHGHPHVDPTFCTGCGECQKACPLDPPAIVVPPAPAGA